MSQKISVDHQKLEQLGHQELLKACNILGVDTTRKIKGGITAELNCSQLVRNIRSCIGRGTFPDRLSRFQEYLNFIVIEHISLESLHACSLDREKLCIEKVKQVKLAFSLKTQQEIFEIISDWVENPQGKELDCDELDFIYQELGLFYEEIEEEFIFIVPSYHKLKHIVDNLTISDVYHLLIRLATSTLAEYESSDRYYRYGDPNYISYEFISFVADYVNNYDSRMNDNGALRWR